eukprot:m.245855 g.245855  ORF g.245855 m.245855 type:complete len:767 (+) comp15369_c3_seq1:150-2450(+)
MSRELEETLRDLVERDSCDAAAVRQACDGESIPDAVRGDVWSCMLNVHGKPDSVSSRTMTLADEGGTLREAAQRLATLYDEPQSNPSFANDLEKVVLAFCQSRDMSFDAQSGFPELVAPFIACKLSIGDAYNCFYSLHNKFALRDSKETSWAFSVFRLLLLYHEPELCTRLDTLKLQLSDLIGTWFTTLFAGACAPPVTLALWDFFFQTADPFLVFFVALVLLVNAKDAILEADTDLDAIKEFLREMPQQISDSDIPDLVDLAQHYSTITPDGFRAQYQHSLFNASGPRRSGSRATEQSTAVDPNVLLCFHLTPSSFLTRASTQSEDAVPLILVDLRPEVQYQEGHFTGSHEHLEAQLMLSDPDLFDTQLSELKGRTEHGHTCFMGSNVDDHLLEMVVAKALQKQFCGVSTMEGGYEALFKTCKAQGTTDQFLDGVYVDHSAVVETNPLVQEEEPKVQPAAPSRLSSWSTAFKQTRERAAAAYREKKEVWGTKLKEKSQELSSALKASIRGDDGLYRPDEIKAKFSIDSDDEDDEHAVPSVTYLEQAMPEVITQKTRAGEFVVSIPLLEQSQAATNVFPCSEVQGEIMYPSVLVLTDTHLLKFRELNAKDRAGLIWEKPFRDIVKVTARKKYPLISFYFKDESADTKSAQVAVHEAAPPSTQPQPQPADSSTAVPETVSKQETSEKSEDAADASEKVDQSEAKAKESVVSEPSQDGSASTDSTTEPAKKTPDIPKGTTLERILVPQLRQAKEALQAAILRSRGQTS